MVFKSVLEPMDDYIADFEIIKYYFLKFWEL